VSVRIASPISISVENQLSRGGAVENQAKVKCAFNVAEEALQRS
jgi:hypothetical protein